MKKNVFYPVVLMLVAAFTFTSCDNLNDRDLAISEFDTQMAEDDAIAEEAFTSLDAMIDEDILTLDASDYNTGIMLKSSSEEPYVCKTITVDHPDTTMFPKVITIDYGAGCSTEINGETYTRKGKIVITITNRWFLEGAVRTAEFVDFYLNDVKVEGTRTVENLGINEDGNLMFAHQLMNGKLIYNDSLVYTRNCTSTHEWHRASNPADDAWYISGTRNGTTVEGYMYQHEITNRLMLVRCAEFGYQWVIVEGEISMTRNGKTAQLNYGEGNCDGTALLTVGDREREIQIRNRYHERRRLHTGQ